MSKRAFLVVTLLILIGVGFYSVNFLSGTLVLGTYIVVPAIVFPLGKFVLIQVRIAATSVWKFVSTLDRRSLSRFIILIILLSLPIGISYILGYIITPIILPTETPALTVTPLPSIIENYTVDIQQLAPNSSVFYIRESVEFVTPSVSPRPTPIPTTPPPPQGQAQVTVTEEASQPELPPSATLPERGVASTWTGLLLREVRISPLQVAPNGNVRIDLPDGSHVEGSLCCPRSRIRLIDFPRGSFYVAKDAQEQTVLTYLQTETIAWSVPNVAREIRFTYIPPPYHYLRPFLAPFLSIVDIGQWASGFLGGVLSTIALPVLRDMLSRFVDRVRNSKGERMARQKKKAVLIVSSRGEQKEIDVRDNDRK